jgi:hypothetical protein
VKEIKHEVGEIHKNMDKIKEQLYHLDGYIDQQFKKIQQSSQFDRIFKLVLFLVVIVCILLFFT